MTAYEKFAVGVFNFEVCVVSVFLGLIVLFWLTAKIERFFFEMRANDNKG